MSKERPKRNIIQKKYVSKSTPLPYLLTNRAIALFKFACSFRWKCINFHHGLWRLASGSLCTIWVKYPLKKGGLWLGSTCSQLYALSLKRQQCLFGVCVAGFLRHQTCFRAIWTSAASPPFPPPLRDLTRDAGMHNAPRLRDKAIQGPKIKGLGEVFPEKGFCSLAVSSYSQPWRRACRPWLGYSGFHFVPCWAFLSALRWARHTAN